MILRFGSILTISMLCVLAPLVFTTTAQADDATGQELLFSNCGGCHSPDKDGAFSRISEQRKTPEGWEMTINRMRLIHGLRLSGRDVPIAQASMRELVKHLADTQGLAPEESQPYRYLIEQDLNRIEDMDPELAVMCGRCHSSARFALQRRTEAEWELLVHFHLGQYPSTEYSLFGRDRDWLNEAKTKTVPALAEAYPLQTAAWSAWQAVDKPDLAGRWILTGHMAGKGELYAVMTATTTEPDYYSLSIEGEYSNGESVSGKGKALVYTGYDWRGQLTFGDESMRQVLAADPSGERLSGRMFLKDQSLLGMQLSAVRDDDNARINSVFPTHIQRGGSQQFTISGSALNGEITLPGGLSVDKVLQRDKNRIVLKINASADATIGEGSIRVGAAGLDNALMVYNELNSLAVEPAYAIARVGGNGGSTTRVEAAFRAVGIDHGADGVAGTDDDLRLGYLDGISWQVAPWDSTAEQDEDVRFAGKMGTGSGIFQPAAAGPNPERAHSTNNAGNLKVIASRGEDAAAISGEGHLIVTVQRWNNPPLR
jgi:quinohemoprotein amine dehydrogenase